MLCFIEEEIRGFLCKFGVGLKDGDDCARGGDDRDVSLVERVLYGASVELLQATIAMVFHLVIQSQFLAPAMGSWWREW